jgi:flagellar hook-basal body complex protein FliE
MIPPISGSQLSVGALSPNSTLGAQRPAATTPGSADTFGSAITKAIDSLDRTQSTADAYSRQVAAGNLDHVEDYMVAAADAQLTTQLTVAVRNKAVEAFQEIMRMTV